MKNQLLSIIMLLGKYIQQCSIEHQFRQSNDSQFKSSKQLTKSRGKIYRLEKNPSDSHNTSQSRFMIRSSRHTQEDEAIKILDLLSSEEQFSSPEQSAKGRKKRPILICDEEDFEMQGWVERRMSKSKLERQKWENYGRDADQRANSFRGNGKVKQKISRSSLENKNDVSGIFSREKLRQQKKKRVRTIEHLEKGSQNNYNSVLPYCEGLHSQRNEMRKVKMKHRIQTWKSFFLKKEQIANRLKKKNLTIDPLDIDQASSSELRVKTNSIEKKERKLLKNQNPIISYVFKKSKKNCNFDSKLFLSIEGKSTEDNSKEFTRLSKLLRKEEKGFVKFDIDKYRRKRQDL